jgi:hypothetical protein
MLAGIMSIFNERDGGQIQSGLRVPVHKRENVKREGHSCSRNCLRREREGCGFAFRFGNVPARLGHRKVTALAAAIGET